VAGQLLPEEADQALEYVLNLKITLYGEATLHLRTLNLARKLTLPATYDAHYLALAEQIEADFYTADRQLFNAVHTTLPWVHLAT
jgi:predicted nucleic acid-binding protein